MGNGPNTGGKKNKNKKTRKNRFDRDKILISEKEAVAKKRFRR